MKAILEKVRHDRDRSFKVFGYTMERFNCPFHYHPEIELTLITGSTGQRYIGDHISRFAPGDLVLMGPNLPHSYVNDAKLKGRAGSLVVQFLPECFGVDFFQLGELKNVQRLLERCRLGLSFHGATRDRVSPLMEKLSGLEGFARMAALLNILEVLSRGSEWRPLASTGYSPSLALYQGERINRVCELISKKFREGITQSEAARAAQMSPPSFSRFFRRATNRTFRAFLNEVRIGHASHLLVESDMTVAQICYDSGFGNLSNFNRQFLKLRRIAPRLYRNDRNRRENAFLETKRPPEWSDTAGWRRYMNEKEM